MMCGNDFRDRIARWADRRSERFWWAWIGASYAGLGVVIFLLLVLAQEAA